MRRIAGSPRLTTARRRNVRWVTEGTGAHVRASRCISGGMEFLQPSKWREALEMRAAHPDATAIWGGTDVMVELNFARKRPEALLDLTRVDELSRWSAEDGWLRIGAGRVLHAGRSPSSATRLPGLAMASRTVGSPQIRNRGTIGGNLGSSSPAGDALPPLYASGAEVELESVRGARRVPVEDFIIGPKRNTLADDELIAAVWMPVAGGPQQFAKVGHAQRDGDRGLLVRAGRCPTAASGRASAPRHRRRCARARPRRSRGELDWERAARRRGGALRRAGRGGGLADRRRARDGGVPPRTRWACSRKRTLTWAWEERRACA